MKNYVKIMGQHVKGIKSCNIILSGLVITCNRKSIRNNLHHLHVITKPLKIMLHFYIHRLIHSIKRSV